MQKAINHKKLVAFVLPIIEKGDVPNGTRKLEKLKEEQRLRWLYQLPLCGLATDERLQVYIFLI